MREMDLRHLATLSTFALYLVVLFLISVVADRKFTKSYEDFVAARRSLGPLTTALSSAASSESAWAILGLSGLGYFMGLKALWAVVGCVLGFLLNALLVIRRLREDSARLSALTLSDYIEARLSDRTRLLRSVSALIIAFFMGVYVVAQFVGAGKVFHEMEVFGPGTSYEVGVVVGALIVGLYVFMGGYAAVCWTDTFQGLVMLCVMVGLPICALVLAGGPYEVIKVLTSQAEAFSAKDLLGFGSAGFIFAQLAVALGYQGMPHVVVRYITVKDDTSARLAGLLAVLWSIFSLTGSTLFGIFCRALYPQDASSCSEAGFCAPTLKASESIVAFFAMHELHPLLAGVVLAAVSAAIMSTADSQLMYAATAIVNDLRPNRSQRRLVLETRLLIALITTCAVLAALQEVKVIYTFVLFAWGALGAAFTPLVLLSLYFKRFHKFGALACMIVGPATVLLWHSPPLKAFLPSDLYSGVFELIPATILSAAAGMVTSLLARRLRAP